MKVVNHDAVIREVWIPPNAHHYWNWESVRSLCGAVWDDLGPYLGTQQER